MISRTALYMARNKSVKLAGIDGLVVAILIQDLRTGTSGND